MQMCDDVIAGGFEAKHGVAEHIATDRLGGVLGDEPAERTALRQDVVPLPSPTTGVAEGEAAAGGAVKAEVLIEARIGIANPSTGRQFEMQETLVALERNARGGEALPRVLDRVHRLAQCDTPEFRDIGMRARPGFLESANDMIGRRVAGWRHLAPGADHTLITKCEIASLSVFSGDTFIEVEAGGSKDVIGFIFFAAGTIEVSPLFELAGFVCDPSEAAAFDAAQVNVEELVSRRGDHRGTADVADDFERSRVAARPHVCKVARAYGVDRGGDVFDLGLLQVLQLYADRGESSRHCAVIAEALIDARPAVEPPTHGHEFNGGGLSAFLA